MFFKYKFSWTITKKHNYSIKVYFYLVFSKSFKNNIYFYKILKKKILSQWKNKIKMILEYNKTFLMVLK